ncbi:restriction endonuclease subunit S [Candidatus Kaiserbacteria bacterium]|nr:restriction endonuclease subunit S [Candidatus Kaiserbacteria bacterium]
MNANYPTKKVSECVQKLPKKMGVPLKQYETIGKFPIVDQGQDFIGGYTDKANLVYKDDLPVIVFGDHTRAIKFIDFPFVVGADGTQVLKPKDFLDPKYFYFSLMSLDIGSRGYARHFRILKEKEIPLPPLAEQKKIVAKLESVLGKIKEAKKLREEAGLAAAALLPAELHKIFSEGKNKGWEEKELGEVIKLQGGFAFKSTEYKTNGIPLVRIKNLQNEEINFRNAVFIDKSERDNLKNFLLKVGDILIAMSGATTGKLARVSMDKLPAFLNQRVGRFVIKDNVKTDVSFLWYFLKSLQDFVLLAAYGGAQPNVGPSKIETIKIPLPPLAEQKKIVARLDALSGKIQKLQVYQKSTQADFIALEQSVLSNAFNT